MPDPAFFGYGSLVNRATHGYATAWRARLGGWRRVWRYTSARHAPYLTATPCADSEIDGLVALVPGGDWRALDQREEGYIRVPPGPALVIDGAPALKVELYRVPPESAMMPAALPPILLSYVDAVLQGYAREFGPEGVARFMATTDGFAAPVLDDRESPRYPRAQALTLTERAMVDEALAQAGAMITRQASPSLETGNEGLQPPREPLSTRRDL